MTLPGNIRTRNYRLESLAPSIAWFDHHLLSHAPGSPDPPVRIYVMGANVWRDEQEWPLARARNLLVPAQRRPRQFSKRRRPSPTEAAGDEDPPDTFLSDPSRPVPSRGGAGIGEGAGMFPQNDVEARADALVYSTSSLSEDVEVTGPVSVTLYVTTSAPSADFTAKLVDVHPDGTAYGVSEGILRRAYQPNSSPGVADPTSIVVALWPTSMVFRKNHRIRLEIAGSNFPRFDRNPNTGEATPTATATLTATQAVHHGARRPSRLVLPVVPPP